MGKWPSHQLEKSEEDWGHHYVGDVPWCGIGDAEILDNHDAGFHLGNGGKI